ncbi:MAG: biliverdin-producing heme oxygenase [Bacteroidota bacterium]
MISILLKESTQEAHMSLERKVIPRIRSIQNDADYAQFLVYFYAYFNALESAIDPYITLKNLPDYHSRRTSRFLKRDIEALGYTIDRLPKVTIPKIDGIQRAFAALYVMEGSIMGGRHIVKMLKGKGITVGLSFFSGYGDATEKRWKRFQTELNTWATSEAPEEVMVETTKETFEHFSRVFDQPVMAPEVAHGKERIIS